MKSSISVLHEIYAPIATELQAVQRLFDQELRCDLPFIESLCDHISRYRGKMLRPALMLLSARACGETSDEHITIAAVLEMVHIATLVHDDVLDNSTTRRNTPTVNAMNGNEAAVLLGDYLISHAYHLCSSLDSQYASRTIASCTNTVCEGELLQVHHRNNWDLNEEQYLTIVSRKTAALTSVACMLGAKYAGADASATNALESYGMDAGVAFQVVDDILDLTASEEELGKNVRRDLLDGKLTLPIIHLMTSVAPDERVALVGLCRGGTGGEQRGILAALNGSIDYAMSFARRRVRAAIASLEPLPPSSAKESLLALADFILQRRI